MATDAQKINKNLDRKHQMGCKNIDSSCGGEDLPNPPRFADQESDRLLRREAETVPGCQWDHLYSHIYLLFVALFGAVGRRRHDVVVVGDGRDVCFATMTLGKVRLDPKMFPVKGLLNASSRPRRPVSLNEAACNPTLPLGALVRSCICAKTNL